MDSILLSYRDPLFSILLIITLSLMIAVLTYIWGIYRQEKEKSTLQKFLEKFESAECAFDTKTMPFDVAMYRPLALLAKAFENSGEYHKSINIYLYLIKHTQNPVDKGDLMERLGQTYLHAGFLERARTIFAEVLHKRPRNSAVLYQLGIVYEMMQQYDKALEVIEPLQLMGEETRELEKFLHFEKVAVDKSILPEQKIDMFIVLLNEEPTLYRPILSLLFRLDTDKAWAQIDRSSLHSILDILWFLPYSQLDLDIISEEPSLLAIYFAKGYLEEPSQKSGIFAIDLLAAGRINGFEEGDLLFSYLCKRCKQSFPVPFARCPNCLALNTIEVEENIGKKQTQTDYSLL
ncbi:MAG: tetratricopeptide repeat protein [Campylobacterota bacterium]|nr:tetratricopeptide repeat protein [Campylobacterota bacterium]